MASYRINDRAIAETALLAAKKIVSSMANDVQTRGRRIVSTGEYVTGKTARSITIVYRSRGSRLYTATVGSSRPNALVIHEGASPHHISPTRATRLQFYWRKVGAMVSLPYVSHPGMTGKPFLTAPLILTSRLHNARVTIH